MNYTAQDLIVTAFGFVASMATALILFLLQENLGFAFYSLTLWFIIPVGAILAGFIAASGYYLGSIIFGHRPTHLLLLNMILVSISTFFVIYWLSYISLEIDGKSASDYISFSKYIDVLLQHQTMEFRIKGARVGTTGELGSWGYVTAILQIIGFAIGGIAIFFYLTTLPYCEKCHKYLKAKTKQVRYSADNDSFTAMVKNIVFLFTNDRLQEALDIHGNFGEAEFPKDGYLMSLLERKQCPMCNVNWLKFSAHKLSGDNWEQINELQFAQFHKGELHP